MSLPPITIPVEIPFEIPLLLHPIVVHFAIVIPIIVLILELANLYFKRRSLNILSFSFLFLTIILFAGLYVTGTVDGKEAYPLLSDAGQAELKEHKLLGIYLVYASLVPIVFKTIAMLVMNKWAKIIYFLILIGFIGVNFIQAKDGGELVYEHGANVKVIQEYENKLEVAEDEMYEVEEGYEEEIDALKSAHQKEIDALKATAASAVVDDAPEAATAVVEEAEVVQEAEAAVAEVAQEAEAAVEEVAEKVSETELTEEVEKTVEEATVKATETVEELAPVTE